MSNLVAAFVCFFVAASVYARPTTPHGKNSFLSTIDHKAGVEAKLNARITSIEELRELFSWLKSPYVIDEIYNIMRSEMEKTEEKMRKSLEGRKLSDNCFEDLRGHINERLQLTRAASVNLMHFNNNATLYTQTLESLKEKLQLCPEPQRGVYLINDEHIKCTKNVTYEFAEFVMGPVGMNYENSKRNFLSSMLEVLHESIHYLRDSSQFMNKLQEEVKKRIQTCVQVTQEVYLDQDRLHYTFQSDSDMNIDNFHKF